MKTNLMEGMLLLAIVALSLAQVAPITPIVNAQFTDFKKKFGKTYPTTTEENYRLTIFAVNFAAVQAHNSVPNRTYNKSINAFSDIPADEFNKIYLNQKADPAQLNIKNLKTVPRTVAATVPSVPSNFSIDWTVGGYVTEVKNQKKCGCCFIFAAIAAVESAYLVRNISDKLDLSEQQLVDCIYQNNKGRQNACTAGGYAPTALKYIKEIGVHLETKYPYLYSGQFRLDSCQMDDGQQGQYKIASNRRTFEEKSYGDCNVLISYIAVKPVAVSVDSNGWQSYSSGIFKSTECAQNVHNHAVLLVGYTKDYWKIKNSWGTTFGENGYIRLAPNNTCGVCNYVDMPIL